MRLIDADSFYDNLMDIYGDKNSLVFLGDVLDLIDQQPAVNISAPECTMTSVKQALPPSSKVVMAYDFRGVLYLECCYLESANGWYDVRRHKPIRYEITYWMNYPEYPEN